MNQVSDEDINGYLKRSSLIYFGKWNEDKREGQVKLEHIDAEDKITLIYFGELLRDKKHRKGKANELFIETYLFDEEEAPIIYISNIRTYE